MRGRWCWKRRRIKTASARLILISFYATSLVSLGIVKVLILKKRAKSLISRRERNRKESKYEFDF